MTIQKAIEIITYHFKEDTVKEDPDFFNACFLGVEALKALKAGREGRRYEFYAPLPGETKK